MGGANRNRCAPLTIDMLRDESLRRVSFGSLTIAIMAMVNGVAVKRMEDICFEGVRIISNISDSSRNAFWQEDRYLST
jgi:hypothetical protein